ncbi:hypothetical protein BpHYR1_014154 [Brachionus plicatilis]|uniref:Uncharacterized protein n=1 Tax=Brachionus plicatilis TaxID=10195 RepID=A0A3M7Q8G0_BRAPC|nr:hypothetical protein BpHYR1_014154 [Brachionus plicatilis]
MTVLVQIKHKDDFFFAQLNHHTRTRSESKERPKNAVLRPPPILTMKVGRPVKSNRCSFFNRYLLYENRLKRN